MAFAVALVFITQLAVILALVWGLWFMRRRLEAMQVRLDESLDDQDLIEFQERVRLLLQEVRDSGSGMIDAITRRQASLEQLLARVRETEARGDRKAAGPEGVVKKTEGQPSQALRSTPATAPEKKPASRGKAKARSVLSPQLPPSIAEAVAAPQTLKTSYVARPFRAPETPSPQPTVPRNQKVYELADQGANREEISKATGILAGEVELILNLRPGTWGKAQ